MKNTLSIKDREIIQKSFLSDHFHGKECWTQGELPEGYDYYFSEKPFKINEEKGNKCAFSYINNPDGSVRWIFASNSKFPGFLDLYNGSGIKGKMLTILFRIIFFLNLQFIVTSGQFYFSLEDYPYRRVGKRDWILIHFLFLREQWDPIEKCYLLCIKRIKPSVL